MSRQRIDFTGFRFGRLTVMRNCGVRRRTTFWECRCDCGAIKEFCGADLKRGHTQSCGCKQREAASKARTKHGSCKNYQRTPEYGTWSAMKERCNCTSNPRYKDYGGRGISVCERWSSSFDEFLKDMGKKPSKKHSLDRIDNNTGYSKDNCRWSIPTEQNRNTRVVLFVAIDGVSKTTYQWSEESKVHPKTIQARLKLGWTAKEAVFTPTSLSNKLVTIRKRTAAICHLD